MVGYAFLPLALRKLALSDRRRRIMWIVVIGAVTLWSVNMLSLLSHRGGSIRHHELQAVAITSPVDSVLHPRTVANAPLEGKVVEVLKPLELGESVVESTEYFAQHGINSPGIHVRWKNMAILNNFDTRSTDPLLIVLVLNDHDSWGRNRSVDDLFTLLATFTHPREQTSLAILISSIEEFNEIKHRMLQHIHAYAQFSLVFRRDFNANGQLNRKNRHDDNLQRTRRRMIARYRNFAIISTLETWHQHVVWLDADVDQVPSGLITKMIKANLDIIQPICYMHGREYDLNAWVGERKKRPQIPLLREGFVPDGLRVQHMTDYIQGDEDFVPLDSVGGTMLYVRADVHRQGVLFPHHFVIGSEWDEEGYDGIETEGLCYEAQFLGYKCWGMPHDPIRHSV